VGAGLPAKGVCQSTCWALIHRHRRQASSHIFSRSGLGVCGLQAVDAGVQVTQGCRRSKVGAGLPAKGVCQSTCWALIHRHRRQASSHIFSRSGGGACGLQAVDAGVQVTQGCRRSKVGAGLPAKGACQSTCWALIHRHRKQTSSHNFYRIQALVCVGFRQMPLTLLIQRLHGCFATLAGVQRRPVRVLTSTHTANTRMLPFTIICQ